MKKSFFSLLMFSATLIGCQNNTAESSKPNGALPASPAAVVADTLCFEFKYKQDVTSCQLIIEGDKVKGYFDWSPFEKDGGHGVLENGVKKGEMITVDWKMMIEGSIQTEELLLKLEGDKLSKMEGELVEKGDKVVIKSPETAKAQDVLMKVDCSKIASAIDNAKAAETAMKNMK
ncbi:MAG: hypothetical protein JNL70_00665 [Saprospiraceae bacterium]|nr:hypothetical protein [Saprospiraceae bacterium]